MRFYWRIRHKLTAGLLLVVGMTVLLSAGAFYGLFSYRRSNKTFSYHQQQLALLGYLDLACSELAIPSWDALESDTSQEEIRAEKLKGLIRIEEQLAKYRATLAKAAEASLATEGIGQQDEWLDQIETDVDLLVAKVTDTTPQVGVNQPRLSNLLWVGSERDVIRRLLTTLSRIRGVVHTEITGHVEADQRNYRISLAVVYSTTVLVFGMLAGLIWLGYRTVFRPIRQLHRGVHKLAAGNFDSRMELRTGDEMQELGEAFNDMTDRLQTMYKDLNRQVEERSRQLIRSERLASVGFLAAGVAHEINNPLASIAFCGEALESRLKPSLREEGEDADVVFSYLQMIQQEAFRCKAITEKLLDFSRVGEPSRVEADLVALVRNVIEMVQHLGRAKGKNLVFEPVESASAHVNPQELKQVLLNLVVNSLESVDEGGTVTIIVRQSADGIEIVVDDDGCGMDAETLENVFEPFFTRNRTGRGTGLGLSISHLIISQHGGSLDASSPGLDRGSTLTVRLPAGSPSPVLAAAA